LVENEAIVTKQPWKKAAVALSFNSPNKLEIELETKSKLGVALVRWDAFS